jgi:large subunit ribosomal protein L13
MFHKNNKKLKMNKLSYRTISANEKIVKKEWVLVDAQELVVGRLATVVARILRGKTKTYYTPHFDCGDNVIIINAEKIRFTGHKLTDTQYVRHTGYPGGQRFATPRELLKKKPIAVLEHAIRGMLPKNRLGDALYRNLYVYAGANHPHEGQQPKLININEIK